MQILEEHASEWETDAQTGEGSWVFSADRFTVPPKVVKPLEAAGKIVKQLTAKANHRLDAETPEAGETAEDKFLAADSWEDRLWELQNDAALINEHKKFDAPFDPDSTAEALINERIGTEPNVTTLMESAAFQDELAQREDEHEERRKRDAARVYQEFRRDLATLQDAMRNAFISLGGNPEIRRAKRKF